MIKTGFKSLDNLVDFSKSGVTILSGFGFADMLSGDIANNICLRQECDVLEIVSCKKEYLIKRLLVNIENLIQVLSRKYKTGIRETHWQAGVWLWNDQNYEYNNYAPSWFPKYKKLDENIQMPDYTKLR